MRSLLSEATAPVFAAVSRTILIIDDNPLVRDVVRRMLEARGYSVLVAEGGAEGLQLLSNNWIDSAIVDVDMPAMNGVDVCRALRERAAKVGRGLWVWLMTGVTRPELLSAAAAAGARGVLPKPFTTDELVRCVEADFRGHVAA